MSSTHTTQQQQALAELELRLHALTVASLAASDEALNAALWGEVPSPVEAEALAAAHAKRAARRAGVSEDAIALTYGRVMEHHCRLQREAGHA